MKSNNPHPKPLCVIDRFHQLQTETESTGFRGTHKRRYGKTSKKEEVTIPLNLSSPRIIFTTVFESVEIGCLTLFFPSVHGVEMQFLLRWGLRLSVDKRNEMSA